MPKVVTYQASNGETIDMTPAAEQAWKRAGKWPKNSRGEEYCCVSHGLHFVPHHVAVLPGGRVVAGNRCARCGMEWIKSPGEECPQCGHDFAPRAMIRVEESAS